MDCFFKYLTPSGDDEKWGLFLKVAGREVIPEKANYPTNTHPWNYYFLWEKGRILDEFQINYITEGSGVYEDSVGKYVVKPGTLLITRPGMWHRYRPNQNTGWTENYIGFDGSIARELLMNPLFFDNKPVIIIGEREEFVDTYQKIFDFILEEKPGYQQVSAGMIMKLLGYIISTRKQGAFTGKRIEKIIQEVCFFIRENIEKDLDFKLIAEMHNLGYSYFRKMFKKYTGVPPVKYHLDLKIIRAKDMLLSSDKIIKEISYELGFQSIYYFSRAFKNKMGVSPTEIRQTQKRIRNY
jgi:AraC-like DNA-binding protein